MGTSYDAIYFFGLVYQAGDADEDGAFENGDWNEEAREVFDNAGAFDFDTWYWMLLGIAPDLDYAEHQKLLLERSLERFGVEGFETTYVGHMEYGHANVVYPVGAAERVWDLEPCEVPDWSKEEIEKWRHACELLSDLLPPSRGPGLFFGPKVG
jgi:hypothetical protein